MLQDLLAAYPEEVRIVVRHNPLRAIHQYADAAANAASCGHALGKFEEVHRALFDAQEQLGSVSWSWIANASGIADTVAFENCVTSRQYARTVAEDVRLADALRLRRSPSVILDGELLGSTPNLEQIAEQGRFGVLPNSPSIRTEGESRP
jgi:protein-disulfide isomerase